MQQLCIPPPEVGHDDFDIVLVGFVPFSQVVDGNEDSSTGERLVRPHNRVSVTVTAHNVR